MSTPSLLKPSSFGGFGGFGKPASGSIGNPVGFGFGAPTKAPETAPVTAGNDDYSSQETVGKSEGGSSGNDETTAIEPAAKVENSGLIGSSVHDEEGEGEENENTVHAVKLKAFRLKKADEKEGSGWAELGHGMFSIFS